MIKQQLRNGVQRLLWRACVIMGAALWWLLVGSATAHAEDVALPGGVLTSDITTPTSPALEIAPVVEDAATTVRSTVAESVGSVAQESVAQQVVQPISKQVVQPVVQPVVQHAVQPAVQQVTKTVVVQPAVQPVVEPVLAVGEQVTQGGANLNDITAGAEKQLAVTSVTDDDDVFTTTQPERLPLGNTPQPESVDLAVDHANLDATDRAQRSAQLPSRSAARNDHAPSVVEWTPIAAIASMLAPAESVPGIAHNAARASASAMPDERCPCRPTPYEAETDLASAVERPAPTGGAAALVGNTWISAPLTLATLSSPNAERTPSNHTKAPDHTPD